MQQKRNLNNCIKLTIQTLVLYGSLKFYSEVAGTASQFLNVEDFANNNLIMKILQKLEPLIKANF